MDELLDILLSMILIAISVFVLAATLLIAGRNARKALVNRRRRLRASKIESQRDLQGISSFRASTRELSGVRPLSRPSTKSLSSICE